MREYKFRAWDKTREEMINTDMLLNTENGMQQYRVTRPLVNGCLDVEFVKEDTILMQYTGLKDKNGVEIYEGDIVIEKSYPFFGNAPEITDSNQKCNELNYVGVVVWNDSYYVDLKVVSNRVRGSAIGNSLYDYTELEVIGNIYENPELLN